VSWDLDQLRLDYSACSDEPLLTHDTMSHVIDVVAKHGADAWWSMSIEELLPPSMKAQADKCGCLHVFAFDSHVHGLRHAQQVS
jgi:isoleucyl-tRNA synthetase